MKGQLIYKFLKGEKGFSFIEILFVSIITVMVIGIIVSVWIFAYGSWITESRRTTLRIDLIKALETIKKDLRLSSLTYMSFYPSGGEPYTAISLPVAETDSDGFFTLNAKGEIDWDKTVIYHVFTDANGDTTLRRTVYAPRDNTMTEDQRYAQLAYVVSQGTGGEGSTTDTEFLKNLDTFELSSLAPVIDFYENSSTPVRVGKVVFGWIKLSPGNHAIRFEVTGKNDSSTGYDIGVDTIMIEPSGSVREVEYYNSPFAPPGSLVVSGGTVSRIYDDTYIWSNDNYLEFDTNGPGNYVEIADDYDLWRESTFEKCSMDNTEIIDEEVRVGLDVPQDDEDGDITWFAYAEAGDSQQEGREGSLPGGMSSPLTIRTVVTHDNIDQEGDLIRVCFKSSSDSPLTIDRAYVTERDGTSGPNGLENIDPLGLEIEEYHRHQQLFFRNAVGDITEGVTIGQDSEEWSVWTAFPLRTDSDYLISLYISSPASLDCKYWQGEAGTVRTYYITGGDYTAAGTPDWSGFTFNTSEDIYIVAKIDSAKTTGTLESQIFDTTMSAPAYNEIKASENKPEGSNIILKARSSSSEYMVGATAWDSIAESSIDGNGRYLQFMAELLSEPYWKVSSLTLSYDEYIREQVNNYPVYDFPEDSNGDPYITDVSLPWIDDVEIDWPGSERICTITGYIARKDDYGQAKVMVDGTDLVKTLSVHIKVSEGIQGKIVEEENFVEIEPRNTGR